MDLRTTPAAPPPPGYTVNFENPPTHGLASGLGVGITGILVSTAFLSLRVYTKAFIARSFHADDWCIILAWMMAMVDHIMFLWLRTSRYIGVHLWETTLYKLNVTLKIFNVASVLYIVLMALAKISLLISYKRLSEVRWYRICIWTTFGVIVAYSFAMSMALIFACTPVEKNWDITVQGGSCINVEALYISAAAATAATDLILLVLPIPMVLKLRLPKKQKVATLLMFAIGSVTLITSCIRLVTLPTLMSNKDLTWAVVTPALWTDLDASLATICGSLPTIRLFLRHVAPRLIGESSTANRSGRFDKSTTEETGVRDSWMNLGSIDESRPGYQRQQSDQFEFGGSKYSNYKLPDIAVYPPARTIDV